VYRCADGQAMEGFNYAGQGVAVLYVVSGVIYSCRAYLGVMYEVMQGFVFVSVMLSAMGCCAVWMETHDGLSLYFLCMCLLWGYALFQIKLLTE